MRWAREVSVFSNPSGPLGDRWVVYLELRWAATIVDV